MTVSSSPITSKLVYLVEQQDGRIEALKPSEFRQRVAAAEKAAR